MANISIFFLFVSVIKIFDPILTEAKVLMILMDDEPVFSFKSKQTHPRFGQFFLQLISWLLICFIYVFLLF